MERLLDLLMTVLPSGGLGALLYWLVSAKLRKARDESEISNIYKQLYESVKDTLSGQTDEITQLQQQVLTMQNEHLRLKQMVNQARICRYWGDHCPIRRQLQSQEGEPLYSPRYYDPRAAPRQHEPQGDKKEESCKSPRGEGADSSADNEPP